jgi:hypothetical protein
MAATPPWGVQPKYLTTRTQCLHIAQHLHCLSAVGLVFSEPFRLGVNRRPCACDA